MIRVTIWNEFYHEKTEENVKALYPNGLHATIKEQLEKIAADEYEIRLADIDMPEHGLTDDVLNNTDVLIWWGHCRHGLVDDAIAAKVVDHVHRGMGFIALHSSHLSKPFVKLMGTPCTLRWRCIDEHARMWKVDRTHPITRGLPDSFELEAEEMYGEPFLIPKPDDLLWVTWYAGGEICRSACTYERGFGKVFYFQPGHETCPSYYNPYVIQIIKNAIDWANPDQDRIPLCCDSQPPFEKIEK